MKNTIAACLLVMLVSLSAHADSQKPTFEVSPKVLTGKSLSDITVGLTYDFNYQRSNLAGIHIGEAESLLHVKLRGTLALDEDLNNDALVSELMAGFSLLGGKAQRNEYGQGVDPNANPGSAEDIGNWGYIYSGLSVRHETDQTFDEQNFSAGLELGYINPRDENRYAFIPSVIFAYEYVDGIASDVEKDEYSRLRIEASLKSSFGKQVFKGSVLEPLGLRLDGRYYRSYDMAGKLEARDQGEITYFAAALTYTNQTPIAGFDRQTFFIQVSDGRIPPNTDDETTVSAGVIVPLFN